MPFRIPCWNSLYNCHPNSKLYSTIFPKRCRLEKYKVLDNTTRGGLQFQCPYCIEDSSSALMVNRYSKDFLSILRAKAPTSIRSWRYFSFRSIYTKLVQNSENCSTKILPINYWEQRPRQAFAVEDIFPFVVYIQNWYRTPKTVQPRFSLLTIIEQTIVFRLAYTVW